VTAETGLTCGGFDARVFGGLAALLGRAGAGEGERAGPVALLVGTTTPMCALPDGERAEALRASALALVERIAVEATEAAPGERAPA